MNDRIKPRAEDRTRCEVWSRVMGYHRPVVAWNLGKQQEHRDRKHFKEVLQ
jgi:anaerobic ribonucleoside-triphosphate reductase